MIFQAGSEVATYRPRANSNADSDVEKVEGEDYHSTGTTPRQQDVKQLQGRGKANISEGPYETPIILRTKRRAPPVQVDDTDCESESEIVIKKKKSLRATEVSLPVVHQE